MNRTVTRNYRTSNVARRLIGKHRAQIAVPPQYPELADVYAVTFLPSRGVSHFGNGLLRRIGSTLMVVLSYEEARPTKPDRFTMPLRGFRAQAYRDGSVRYGGEAGCSFCFDGSLSPRPNAKGQALSATRSPGLVDLLLRLDQACKVRIRGGHSMGSIPQLPRILLGFAPDQPPEFEDSIALRRKAARRLGITLEQLGKNDPVLREPLLRHVWQRQLIAPHTANNPTDVLLVDAELCTQAGRSLMIYEDFRGLVGVDVWNPARDVTFLTVENPARDILRRFDVDVSQNFNQQFPDDFVEKLELTMRDALGHMQVHFTLEELLDAITNPHLPLIGYTTSLRALRSKLSQHISACCTDEDLLWAARHTAEPLLASKACKIQVLGKNADHRGSSFCMTQSDLGRRIEVDLSGSLPNQMNRHPTVRLAGHTAAIPVV
jgi:hypothetical protein